MKQLFVCSILYFLSFSFLCAEVCWNEPVKLTDFNNVYYSGEGCKTVDNCIVLSWEESAGDNSKRYVQKYSAQMIPQWDTMPELPRGGDVLHMIETSDGNFIIIFNSGGLSLNGYKLNSSGEQLWDSNSGISIVTNTLISNSICIPDNSGGAYFIAECYGSSPNVLQHLNSDGTVSFTPAGLVIETGDCWNLKAILLPDNSIIVKYLQPTQNVIKKVDLSGQIIWEKYVPFPITGESDTRPSDIYYTGDNSFLLFAQFNHQVIASKYDTNGNVIWENTIVVDNSSTSYISSVNYAMVGQNIIIVWRTSSAIKAQKIDFNGQMLWQNDGITVDSSSLQTNGCFGNLNSNVYDNLEGVYVVYDYYSTQQNPAKTMFAQHISITGNVWAQPVQFAQTDITNNNLSYCFSTLFDNRLSVNWYENRGQQSGIYGQSIDINGNLLYQASGLQVKTGSRGGTTSQVVVALPNKAFVFWVNYNGYVNDFYDFYSTITYQIVDNNGALLLPAGGQALNTDVKKVIRSVKTITLPGNQILVYWLESPKDFNIQGDYYIKAQLMDSNANQLWETNGKVIFQSSSKIKEYLANYYDGSVYFLWTTAETDMPYRIYGQRYANGTPQWNTTGVQIASSNPALPAYNYNAVNMVENWICWQSYDHEDFAPYGEAVYFLKIDENGQPLPGFNAFGNRIAEYTTDYDFQDLIKIMSIPDGLFIVFTNWDVIQNSGSTSLHGQSFAQKVDSAGVLQFGLNGIVWDYSNYSIASDSHIYSYSFYPYSVNKLNLDLTLDTLQTVDVTNGNFYSTKNFQLTNNRILATLFYFRSAHEKFIMHYYYDEDINIIIPSSYIVASIGDYYTYDAAVSEDNGYIIWENNNMYNSPATLSSKLFIQRVNNGDVSSEDLSESSAAIIDLKNNYPNPFTNKTTISFDLKDPLNCEVDIYNIKGQLVKTLSKGLLPKGENKLEWDGKDNSGISTATGIYFYRVNGGKHTYTKKMIRVK